MNRLFLDSNVLFTAAHNPDGKAALVVRLAVEGRWRIVASKHAIEEARRNVAAKYPDALERLTLVTAALRIVGQPSSEKVVAARRVDPGHSNLPPQDRLILDAALGCGATHLLTGDVRHFGALLNAPDASAGLPIQTVAEYLSGFASP